MPVLSANAFGASAKSVQILSPGTTGRPSTPGVDLRASILPQEAKAEGVELPDHFVVVAHLPQATSSGTEWTRVVLQSDPERRVGYHGEVAVDDFHADDVPVDAALAGMVGIWFSVESAPHVTVTERPGFLGIDSTPGDLLAWGQRYGENVVPRG